MLNTNILAGHRRLEHSRQGKILFEVTTMQLSVVSVAHKNLAGLSRTYRSLRRLATIEYEWIVIDSGACEQTLEWLQSHEPGVARFQCKSDRGIYHAMNRGLAMSRGKWIWFLNSGDEVSQHIKCDELETALGQEKTSVIFSDYEIINRSFVYYKRASNPNRIWYAMNTSHQAMIFSATSLGKGYSSRALLAGDYQICRRLYDAGEKFEKVEGALARVERAGRSTTYFDAYRYEVALMRRVEFNDKPSVVLGTLILQLMIAIFSVFASPIYHKIRSRSTQRV